MKIIITEQQNEKVNRKIRFAVEKLGLPQAREVFGDDLIKRLYVDNPDSFLEQFNNLKKIKEDNEISYLDNNQNMVLYYNPEAESDGYSSYFINYERVWSFFEEIMEYDDSEIQEEMENWVSSTFRLTDLPVTYFKEEWL